VINVDTERASCWRYRLDRPVAVLGSVCCHDKLRARQSTIRPENTNKGLGSALTI
jgi:hypothetical protein